MPPSMARPTVPGFASASSAECHTGMPVSVEPKYSWMTVAPPVDHRALDLRRAGRCAMDDEAQRRQIVAALHLVRQPQQPHEHGRHHVHVGDAMARDQLQHVFGIEARFEHDFAAAAERQHAVGVRRRMVHRPVHQDDLVVVRLDAIGDAADPRRGRLLFRLHRLAAHALGQAGGAGRVEHRRAADRRRPATPHACRASDPSRSCRRARASASAATLNAAAISGGVVTTSSLIWAGRPSLICGSRSAWQTRISAPLSARM